MTNSTSDIRVLKKDSKVEPRYLKAPDGSCHINCKIGYILAEPEMKISHRRKLLSRMYSTDKGGKNSTVDTMLVRHGERKHLNELRSPRKKGEDSKSSITLMDKHQFGKKVGPRLTKMGSVPSSNRLQPIIDKDDDQTKPRLANRRRMSDVIVSKETSRRLSDAIDRRKNNLVSPNAQHSLSRPSSAKGGLSKNIRKANLCNSNLETRHNQPHIPEVALPEPKAEPFNDKKTDSSWDENDVSSSQLTSILDNKNVETDTNMKFKRGTIIDVENEDNGPWRLNFNQGSIISQLGEVGKEEIELREVVPNETTGDSENMDPERINLKHVDELEKDNPSSLDNMIEEATNKLVQSRKNKVKAMVSAFETVMSIRDAKSLVRKRSI